MHYTILKFVFAIIIYINVIDTHFITEKKKSLLSPKIQPIRLKIENLTPLRLNASFPSTFLY